MCALFFSVNHFAANDSVASCWYVDCEIGIGNRTYARSVGGGAYTWNGNSGVYSELEIQNDGMYHGQSCGRYTVINNDLTTLYESDKRSYGRVTKLIDNDGRNGLSQGDYVKWYTTDSNGTGTYWHFCTAQNVDNAHPNRS